MKSLAAVALFAVGLLTGTALHVIPSAKAQNQGTTSIERRLTSVEDHIAIERLLMEYGRTLDKRDFAAFSQLFATNGAWSGNIGIVRGRAAIQAAMEKAFNPPAGAAASPFYHVLTNAIIDIDGDRATAVSKWTFVQFVGGRPQIGAVGYYNDTLVRENGHWRFLLREAPAMRSVGTSGKIAPTLR